MSKVKLEIELDLNNPRDLEIMSIITHWKKTGDVLDVGVEAPRKKMTPKERAKVAADARWKKDAPQTLEPLNKKNSVTFAPEFPVMSPQSIIAQMNEGTPPSDGRAIMEGVGSMSNDEFQNYLQRMRSIAYGNEEVQRPGSE